MIDAHVHLWRLGRNGCTWPTPEFEPIYRDFTLDDLAPLVRTAAVDEVIIIQSQEDAADTAWLLSIADDPMVAAVVGWTDFLDANALATIGELASDRRLKGLRPMVQDRDEHWYDAPELDVVFAAMTERRLVLDALVRPRHLPALLGLAIRHPDLAIVIDHGAKPACNDLDSWANQMDLLARQPNVACKLSGLLTELSPGAPAQDVTPVVDRLWKTFGAERLIWGSDWPVLTLRSGYRGWLDQCRRLIPPVDHARVFDTNARRIYGLQVS
ncbi:MAG TPA: amidohydrolase family protein [Sphingomicrobium sp.]|nr:amidohydrolase family protein [Sphingomicrobium sp.]